MFASQTYRNSNTCKASGNHREGFTERRGNNTSFQIT